MQSEHAVGLAGGGCPLGQCCGELLCRLLTARLGLGGETGEEGGVGLGQFQRLQAAGLHLAAGCHVPALAGQLKRLPVAGQGLGDGRESLGDVLPVLGRGRGHEVEDLPQRLHGRVDDVQLPVELTRVEEFELQAQAFAHRGVRDPVDLVLGLDRLQLTECGAVEFGPLGDPGRREIRQPVIVARQAEIGGQDRIECGQLGDIGLGDGVSGGRGAGFGRSVAHAEQASPAPPPGSRRGGHAGVARAEPVTDATSARRPARDGPAGADRAHGNSTR